MTPGSEIQAILNAFAEPAILLSLDYEILYANATYRRVYGYDSDAGRPRRCFEVSHGYSVPCDQAGESCPLRRSLESGAKSRVLHIHHTPRGDEYVNVEMWPVKDPETGATIFFIERMHPSDAATAGHSIRKLVGRAPAFQKMLYLVERVARSDSNVMLLGETGTGKEIVAETIHRLSARSTAPFVPVECAGLPEALFETELFGHVRGAFTGATSDKAGLVEAANGGTLFLDEVGEIPIAGQVKLLRLLETRRYRRVGSSEWRETDFRLICATNRNLVDMVREGTFREDLYYRLNVFEIRLPPLRDRKEDLEPLIRSILERLGKPEYRFTERAVGRLRGYAFPGNIRELRNVVERAVLLAEDLDIDSIDLPAPTAPTPPEQGAPRPDEITTLDDAEQRYLRFALAHHHGDRKALAAKLGISERALYRKIATLRQAAEAAPLRD